MFRLGANFRVAKMAFLGGFEKVVGATSLAQTSSGGEDIHLSDGIFRKLRGEIQSRGIINEEEKKPPTKSDRQ